MDRNDTPITLAAIQAQAIERAEREAQERAHRFRSPEEKRAELKQRLLDDVTSALDSFLSPTGAGWKRLGSVSPEHDASCFRSFADAARAHITAHTFRSLGEFAAWLLEALRGFQLRASTPGIRDEEAALCRRSIDMIHEIARFTFGTVRTLYPEKGIEDVLRIAAKHLSSPIDHEPPSMDGSLN
jgi:hypothetical protein